MTGQRRNVRKRNGKAPDNTTGEGGLRVPLSSIRGNGGIEKREKGGGRFQPDGLAKERDEQQSVYRKREKEKKNLKKRIE